MNTDIFFFWVGKLDVHIKILFKKKTKHKKANEIKKNVTKYSKNKNTMDTS